MQPSRMITVCVILPPTRMSLINADRLAQTPNLDVRYIAYTDPPAVRQARKRGDGCLNYVMTCVIIEISHQPEATAIALKRWIIQAGFRKIRH